MYFEHTDLLYREHGAELVRLFLLGVVRFAGSCTEPFKFCMVGGLQGIVLRFEFHQNRSSGFGAVGK